MPQVDLSERVDLDHEHQVEIEFLEHLRLRSYLELLLYDLLVLPALSQKPEVFIKRYALSFDVSLIDIVHDEALA